MLGGVSAADYKKKVKDFLGEDARIFRKLATKDAWELILDNMPMEVEPGEKLEEDRIERVSRKDRQWPVRGSTEEPRKIFAERFEKKETEKGGEKKKKIDHQEDIYNIQTEGGPLKEQYLTENREGTEDEGEQTGTDDTPMSGVTSTIKEGGKGDRAGNKRIQSTNRT